MCVADGCRPDPCAAAEGGAGQFCRGGECLASCGTAPVLLIDNERHENLSMDEVDELLEKAS